MSKTRAPYAGFDPTETSLPELRRLSAIDRRVAATRAFRHTFPHAVSAYERFRAGEDAADLGKAYDVPEAEALYWVNIVRSKMRRLACPYETKPSSRILVVQGKPRRPVA